MSKKIAHIFPDTNIFLHFQFFTEIDWKEVLQTNFVTLIIPPIITKELNKHKYSHPLENIRSRADKVTKKFAEILYSNNEFRPNVSMLFEKIQLQEEFINYNLDKESQDDHLIASILYFQKKTNQDGILITNDVPLLVLAHQLNIKVKELPESYRVKSQESSDKKKIAKLEKEILELKLRLPKLKLGSVDNDKKIFAQKYSIDQLTEIDVKSEVENIKKENPQIKETYKPKRVTSLIINGSPYPNDKVEFVLNSGEIKQASLKSVEEYNKKLDQYYSDYEEYLIEKNRIIDLRSRTVKLQVELKNLGNIPAERVQVFLIFPEEFKVTIDKEVFAFPQKLNLPRLITVSDIFNKSQSIQGFLPDYDSLLKSNIPKIKIPWEEVDIEKDNNIFTASFQSLKLSHGYSLKCPKNMYVIFPKNQTIHPFQINYRIAADNLPKDEVGKLNILIDKNNSRESLR